MLVANRINFSVESFPDLWAEAEPLVRANFDEMRLNGDEHLHLSTETYAKLSQLGALRIHTARVADTLVGYRVLVLTLHSHTNKLVARCDALYVTPQHRAEIGALLLRWSDRKLGDEGIVKVYQAYKPSLVNLRRLLEACFYTPIEVTYARLLTPSAKKD